MSAIDLDLFQHKIFDIRDKSLRKLVLSLNQIEDIQWTQQQVINQYQLWISRLVSGYLSGYFSNTYFEHKRHEGRGYKLSHEIVRQFDINETYYRGIPQFLALYDACYAHMATEIPCEKIGKQMKLRLNKRDRLDRYVLSKEIVIACNGPSVSDMDKFIDEAVDIFLSKHRPPIISNSKYDIGQVIDRYNNNKSKFRW